MTDQTNIREYLLAAVPIREVASGGKYVFPKDIPQPYRDQFQRDTAGQTATRIDNELAYYDYDFTAWLNRTFSSIRLKHMGSSAADLKINYQIDTTNHVVSLQANAFDSALIADFLGRVLLQRNGILVIRDDRTEWNPERPPYRVFLTLCGQRFEVAAHRLMQEVGGGIAIVLNPMLEQIDGGFEEEVFAAVGKLVIDKLKGHDEVAYAIFDELCPLFQNKRFPYHKVLTHTVLQHVSESEDAMEARLLQRMHPEDLEYLRTSPGLSSLFEKK